MLSIKSIRDNFTRFGYDLSHLTDKQLEQGVIKSARIIHNTTMFTVVEATKAAIEFSRMING